MFQGRVVDRIAQPVQPHPERPGGCVRPEVHRTAQSWSHQRPASSIGVNGSRTTWPKRVSVGTLRTNGLATPQHPAACFAQFGHYTPRAVLDLRSLNPQQRLAVETLNGPVLILAGAGTGKTRVITFRIAHLLEKGVAPQHILAVTFTNKAAREMQERVNQLVPRKRNADADSRPTLCTFHSLCVRILRRHIEKLGYKRNFVIYTESDQLGAVKKILSHVSAKGEKLDAAKIQGLISRFKNSGAGLTPASAENDSAVARHLMPRYDSALRACNAVDFDDLLLLTLKLFKEHPDVFESCRQQYRYVMVY